MIKRRRQSLALVIAAVYALGVYTAAQAHANLLRSQPEAGASVPTTPPALVLEFSEALDPQFSRVQLVNSRQQIVNAGPGTIDPAQPLILRLPLTALTNDTYTAVWRARSAVDGHITEGNIPFAIGVAAEQTALFPAPGTPDPATALPADTDAVARWLLLLSAALAFGAIPFAILVWHPAMRALDPDRPWLPTSTLAQWRRLMLAGGILFLLGNLLFLLVQAHEAAPATPLLQWSTPILQLLGGRSGQLLLVRVILTVIVLALVAALPRTQWLAPRWWYVLAALAAAVLLTFSLSGHGATVVNGRLFAIAADWLHIAAMVAWLGGLVPLLFAIRAARTDQEQGQCLPGLIPRFSRLALACVVLITLTGVYSALLQFDRIALLWLTTYGRALLVKLALFAVLIGLGAVNLLVLTRRLTSNSGVVVQAFGRTIRVELIAGTILLLAVGVMTGVAPATSAWQAHVDHGPVATVNQSNVQMVVWATGHGVGNTSFAVDVTDRRPGSATVPPQVLLRFTMAEMDMGTTEADATTHDGKRFTAQGSYLAMAGHWKVDVIFRREGFRDVQQSFTVSTAG